MLFYLIFVLTSVEVYSDSDFLCIEKLNFTDLYSKNLQPLVDTIDFEIDPCENFFEHACGNFDENAVDVPPFLYNTQDRIQFFNENRNKFATNPGRKLNLFFESCRNNRNSLKNIFHEVEFLRHFENWPFLRYEWESKSFAFDWINLLAKCSAHGISVFLKIFFAPNTIYLSPSRQLCPSLDEMEEVMRRLDVENEQIVGLITSEILDFCSDLEDSLQNLTRAGDDNQNFQSLLEEIPEFEWGQYFESVFRSLGMNLTDAENSQKIVADVDVLREILRVAINTESRVVANYIFLKVAMSVQYEDCYFILKDLEEILLSEYWNWTVFDAIWSKEAAMTSFMSRVKAFEKFRQRKLSGEDWSTFMSSKSEKKDHNIERLIYSYANAALDVERVTEDYSTIRIHRRKFFRNLFEFKREIVRISYLKESFDDESPNHPSYFLRLFIDYVIIFMKQPPFHYFATQDLEMWRDSNLLFTWDEFFASLDCFNRQTDMYSEEWDIFVEPSPADEVTVTDIFNYNLAFRHAIQDYELWLEGEPFYPTEELVLKYFNLSPDNIMYYSLAQNFCGRNDKKYRHVINRSFANFDGFALAFECPQDSAMHPAVKCEVHL